MSATTGALPTSTAARRAASQILSENRFHNPKFPRPLHGLLNSFGKALDAPLKELNRFVNWAAKAIPGGVPVVWAVLAAAVIVLVIWLASRSATGRLAGSAALPASGTPSAGELERLAAAAQAAGRLEQAVRLRFRAGLVRLAEREVISGAATRPTAEISQVLDSPRFDSLADRFDEIAYGDSPATTEDIDQQAREWPPILKDSKPQPGAEAGARP